MHIPGQHWRLQYVEFGPVQFLPPYSGFGLVHVLVLFPPPQDLEQLVQLVQLPSTSKCVKSLEQQERIRYERVREISAAAMLISTWPPLITSTWAELGVARC